ncbi:MAG: sulfatase-like hydrolase/transferase [Phycisphaerae bacterium]|nr:sulfatase-like hydrolase/transferase [Phycisphaerae bacterium]
MMKHYPSRNLSWAVLALVVLILVPRTVAAAPAAKRNVVFFLVDDMRYDAMSCMGHPFLETPAIDALAAGGVHFRKAFFVAVRFATVRCRCSINCRHART